MIFGSSKIAMKRKSKLRSDKAKELATQTAKNGGTLGQMIRVKGTRVGTSICNS